MPVIIHVYLVVLSIKVLAGGDSVAGNRNMGSPDNACVITPPLPTRRAASVEKELDKPDSIQ